MAMPLGFVTPGIAVPTVLVAVLIGTRVPLFSPTQTVWPLGVMAMACA